MLKMLFSSFMRIVHYCPSSVLPVVFAVPRSSVVVSNVLDRPSANAARLRSCCRALITASSVRFGGGLGGAGGGGGAGALGAPPPIHISTSFSSLFLHYV